MSNGFSESRRRSEEKRSTSFFSSFVFFPSTRCLSVFFWIWNYSPTSVFDRPLFLSTSFLPQKTISINEQNHRFDATARAASEAASAADAKWRLSSRARAAAVDAKRLYPYYRDKTKKFVATPFGQASAVGALLLLLWTGVLGRLLNLAFLVYWLAPLLLLPLAQAGATRAQREQEAQRRRAEEEARRARWGPAADWFGGGGGRGGGGVGGGGGRGGFGSGGKGPSSSSDGEIIDVEVD